MPFDLAAFTVFAFVAAVTPGPNNIMAASSGAAFGFRRTVPHMLGIAVGFAVMVALVGTGIAPLLATNPTIHAAMRYVGAAFLLYLAWRILQARKAEVSITDGRARPMRFHEAALFQWVNPKGWQMALAAITAYIPADSPSPIVAALAMGAIFGIICFPSVSIWIWLGMRIEALLTTQRRRDLFFGALALSLALSVIPAVL